MQRFTLCLLALILTCLGVEWWLVASRSEPPPPVPTARREVVRAEPQQDIGPFLHECGRPCLFDSKTHRIGDTPYTVTFGPNYYEDVPERTPAFYTIQVCLEPVVPQPPAEPP